MEKINPSNAGSIPALVEGYSERQTDFKQTAIFLRHIEFDVVKGIRQQNVATQFDANSAANWKAVVWDDLNVLTLAVQADFDHLAPDVPLRCFGLPNNELSRKFGAGAVRLQLL